MNSLSDTEQAVWEACPGKGVDYPATYRRHYGHFPPPSPFGVVQETWIGHASNEKWRTAASSGGVLSRVLHHLLATQAVDAVIVARQSARDPLQSEWAVVRDPEALIHSAQSIYTPVPMLEALAHLTAGEEYAMSCLPDQSAALRYLQHVGNNAAQQVKIVVGPFVGTGLQPAAVDAFLRRRGVCRNEVSELRWRDGEWPGGLAVFTKDGRTYRMPKFYYNHLTPFFLDRQSLQSTDFYNEFADIAVGDAWSPQYEEKGRGFSLVLTRTTEATNLLTEMAAQGDLVLEAANVQDALAMHAHMRDFKNRGSFIRNRFRRWTGRASRDNGQAPTAVPLRRYFVEAGVSGIFAVASSPVGRATVSLLPDSVLGPVFASLRVRWKAISKSTKRHGLGNYGRIERKPKWLR